jgi:hypothetical protein
MGNERARGLPTTTRDIGADWLNDVLSDDTRGGARVTDVAATVIGEGVGFVGEVSRLRLTYDAPSPTSTRTMISKLPTANEGFRQVGMTLGLYEKESRFYAEVAADVGFRIPEAYANLSEGGTDFVLLLEDLAPMRPGDQLASCSPAEARLALDAVSSLHARWWQDPGLAAFSSWLPGPDSPYHQILEGAYLQSVQPFHDNWGHLVDDDVERLVDRVAADYQAVNLLGGWREPLTFIHGDFRLDNMMFGDGEGVEPFALLDFQLPFLANPMWDVVYFLAGNFEPDWRNEHEAELVQHYHSSLVARGVTDFSYDDCWQSYRAAALILLGYLVTSANDVDLETLDDRGREVVETMFRRYGTAITDLGASEFLPA